MANITLKVDDKLLKKARDLANKRKTSINAIIRQKIAEFAESDMSRTAAVNGLESFYRKSRARLGKKRWIRDELHER
jgi:predicted transcriptional regulator